MSSEEELVNEIKAMALSISTQKAEKKPKDEWFPLVGQMNSLKVSNSFGFINTKKIYLEMMVMWRYFGFQRSIGMHRDTNKCTFLFFSFCFQKCSKSMK